MMHTRSIRVLGYARIALATGLLSALGIAAGLPGATTAGAIPADLSSTTSSVQFDELTLGDVGLFDVNVQNQSSSPITITGYQVTGPNAGDFTAGPDFFVSDSSCSQDASGNMVVPPTGGCFIAVLFVPVALGPASATLTLADTMNSGLSFSLSGVGAVGYYQVSSNGKVAIYGNAGSFGDASNLPLKNPIVGIAQTGDNGGYWLVASDGGIFNYGDASFFGSTGGLLLNKPIVGMVATPDAGGYWLVASDGGIFNYGDASFFGSTGGMPLNKPIVGMAATIDGGGYWLVASDGGIFAYGDAQFYGSTGGTHLNQPIVGMASTPDSRGYWLVAADGGIFAYGDAQFYGSTGAIHLNQPIVAMTAMPTGNGYWFTAADGGLFNYGDATFEGAATGQIGNVVGMTTNGAPVISLQQLLSALPALRDHLAASLLRASHGRSVSSVRASI